MPVTLVERAVELDGWMTSLPKRSLEKVNWFLSEARGEQGRQLCWGFRRARFGRS